MRVSRVSVSANNLNPSQKINAGYVKLSDLKYSLLEHSFKSLRSFKAYTGVLIVEYLLCIFYTVVIN